MVTAPPQAADHEEMVLELMEGGVSRDLAQEAIAAMGSDYGEALTYCMERCALK